MISALVGSLTYRTGKHALVIIVKVWTDMLFPKAGIWVFHLHGYGSTTAEEVGRCYQEPYDDRKCFQIR